MAFCVAMRMILDTCVLFPVATREILLNYSKAGGFTPIWSDRILEEWRLAAEAKLSEEDSIMAAGDRALLGAHFPNSLATDWERLQDEVTSPDPDDAHVIAAARAGQADGIITFNLRDFPMCCLAPYGLYCIHPDEFLRNAFLRDRQRLQSALVPLADAAAVKGLSFRTFLKRGNLPRLGKAWELDSG